MNKIITQSLSATFILLVFFSFSTPSLAQEEPATNSEELASYYTELEEEILNLWAQEKNFLKGNFEAKVNLEISKEGKITKTQIISSSENKQFDKELLTFLKDLSVKKIPENIPNEYLNLNIFFIMTKRMSGGNLFVLVEIKKEYTNYRRTVSKIIGTEWNPGKGYTKPKGQDRPPKLSTKVNFQIDKTGKTTNVSILEPSVDNEYDDFVLKYVQGSTFPAPPETITGPVQITTRYTYDFQTASDMQPSVMDLIRALKKKTAKQK